MRGWGASKECFYGKPCDVLILCHRSTGTSPVDLLQSFVFSMNGPCFELSFQRVCYVPMLKWFFFFYAPISNVYVFEFLVLRHSNAQFKWIFYAQRKWKIVPVNGWSHLFESQLNEVFVAAEGAASSGDM